MPAPQAEAWSGGRFYAPKPQAWSRAVGDANSATKSYPAAEHPRAT